MHSNPFIAPGATQAISAFIGREAAKRHGLCPVFDLVN